MLSYRFIVKGKENWLALKEELSIFEIEVIKKIRYQDDTYVMFAKINETDEKNILETMKELSFNAFRNTQLGCIDQAKKELGDRFKDDLITDMSAHYVLTNKILNWLEGLGMCEDSPYNRPGV